MVCTKPNQSYYLFKVSLSLLSIFLAIRALLEELTRSLIELAILSIELLCELISDCKVRCSRICSLKRSLIKLAGFCCNL